MANQVSEDRFELNTKVTQNEAQSKTERMSSWKYCAAIDLLYHVKSVLRRALKNCEVGRTGTDQTISPPPLLHVKIKTVGLKLSGEVRFVVNRELHHLAQLPRDGTRWITGHQTTLIYLMSFKMNHKTINLSNSLILF